MNFWFYRTLADGGIVPFFPVNNPAADKKGWIPSICGGGGFGYGGVGGHAGKVHGEILGLVQYDSREAALMEDCLVVE